MKGALFGLFLTVFLFSGFLSATIEPECNSVTFSLVRNFHFVLASGEGSCNAIKVTTSLPDGLYADTSIEREPQQWVGVHIPAGNEAYLCVGKAMRDGQPDSSLLGSTVYRSGNYYSLILLPPASGSAPLSSLSILEHSKSPGPVNRISLDVSQVQPQAVSSSVPDQTMPALSVNELIESSGVGAMLKMAIGGTETDAMSFVPSGGSSLGLYEINYVGGLNSKGYAFSAGFISGAGTFVKGDSRSITFYRASHMRQPTCIPDSIEYLVDGHGRVFVDGEYRFIRPSREQCPVIHVSDRTCEEAWDPLYDRDPSFLDGHLGIRSYDYVFSTDAGYQEVFPNVPRTKTTASPTQAASPSAGAASVSINPLASPNPTKHASPTPTSQASPTKIADASEEPAQGITATPDVEKPVQKPGFIESIVSGFVNWLRGLFGLG